jgi:DNA-binding transcriptional LysR family regulator
MTQQPLSQQIYQLEAELGVSLFYRTKRRIQLTDVTG